MKLLTTIFHLTFFIFLFSINLYADGGSNDSCNGELISELNNITVTTSRTETGTLYDGQGTDDDNDYYYFRPGVAGSLTINSYTSNENTDLYVATSGCGDNKVLNNAKSYSTTTPISIGASDTVYILISRKKANATTTYSLPMTFTPTSTGSNACSNPHAFEERVSYILPGDLIAIGNSNICADNNRDGVCDTDQERRNDSGVEENNIIHINASSSSAVSSEPGTLENTTAAQLSIPAGATIKWAGLYWQGEIWDIKTSNTSRFNNGQVIENGEDGQDRKALADKIKFKMPGGNYQDLTADEHYYVFLKRTTWGANEDYRGIPRYEMHYQSYKDVTSLLQGLADPNGNYFTADIQATVGRLYYPGVEAGWTLQVIYEYQDAKVKSVTINDGYVALYSTASEGDDYATDNNCPTGGVNTGVYAYDVDFDISGFLTPKVAGFDTDLTLFVTESDPDGSPSDGSGYTETLHLTKKDGSLYLVDGPEAWNYEITNKDGSDNLDRTPAYIYPIGMTLKNYRLTDALDTDQTSTHLYFQTDYDRLIIGVIGFSTELRKPELCYDYSYKQYDRYFTEDNNGSYEPRIVGDGLTVGEPITVELFIQNTETSDIVAKDMTVNIVGIDTDQARYITGTTYYVPPEAVFPIQHIDTDSGAGHINDIIIGDIDSQDYFYVDYDLDPQISNINMALNAQIEYTAVFPYGLNGETIEIEYSAFLNSDIPLCTSDNFQYLPSYGEFNVEDTALAGVESDTLGQIYNLPTQTANRAGDFKIASYDPVSINERKNVSTIVAIELIDAGKYHGIEAACKEPDSALTPRIWVPFGTVVDGNVSLADFNADTIQSAIDNGLISTDILGGTSLTSPGEFYQNVRENVAFRISYNTPGDGTLLKLTPSTCVGNQIGPCYELEAGQFSQELTQIDLGAGAGRCVQDLGTGTDTIPEYCGNEGARGLDSVQLATCMECIYGYNIDFLCSRDNFAIRPESFRVNLKDQDQNDITQKSFIALNNDITTVHDNDNTTNTGHQIVAGYQYALEVNATNHENETPTPGYDASFLTTGEDGLRTYQLKWHTVAGDTTYCNDTEDQNKTVTFFNGHAELNVSSDQIGKYDLNLYDKLWTRVDWNPTLMTHHTGTHFLTGKDCVENSSYVPPFPSVTAINGTDLDNVSGCNITSENHINSDTGAEYVDLPLRVHPYKFDQSGVFPAIGPYTRTNGQTFIYIDTPPTMDANDTEMSYNMNGTFSAVSYDNVKLTNFVTQCYAADVDMNLTFTYNIPEPPITPFLSYSLKDHNTTDSTVIYRPATGTDDFEVGQHDSSNAPLVILQDEAYFVKEMNGSITMDLGYNFARTYNQPLNPRFITFHDFNLTYNINPTGVRADISNNFQIFGNKDLDDNVTFVYGRAKSSQYFYEDVLADNIDTPNSIVIYCDQDPITCSAIYNIETVLSKTEEFDWYLSRGHVSTDNDGNVTLVASTGGSVVPTDPTVVPINNSGGVNNPNVNVSATVNTRPLDVFIDFGAGTNRWLIYNKDFDEIPSPFYRVRFIGQSDWAGTGDTGHVVESNSSIQQNKRLGW